MNILLSIKPEYIEKIFSGEKRYEYRKNLPQKEIKKVIIYATKPIGAIVGEFEVLQVLKLPPQELWIKTKAYSGVSEKFYQQYFLNKEIAYAFEITKAVKYLNSKPLSAIGIFISPPQNFYYLP